MCVAALPLISVVAGLAGTAVSAVGAMQQGKAAAASADYQAAVNNNNSIIAKRNAQDALDRGAVEEQEHRRKVQALKGRQTAVMAANGLDVTSGSPLDILGDTAQMGELDALTIRGNAKRESLGYESQSTNFKAEAGLNKMQGQSAKTAGTIGAFGTVVSGLGGVADKWYRAKSGVSLTAGNSY